jgi:histone acetyltransferase HTATIP
MTPICTPILDEHQSVFWPLQSFTVDNDFKSPHPAQLFLDRANSEFGLIYQIAPGVVVMAQFPDTDEPVYFQVSRARAVCSRLSSTCKKVCVLMQHFQIDLEFRTSDQASGFLQSLGRLATKVGNLYLEIYEAAS